MTAPVLPGAVSFAGGAQATSLHCRERGTRACGLCAQRVSNPLPRQSTYPAILSGVKLRWAHRLESLCSLLGAQAAEHRRQAGCARKRKNQCIYKSSAICTAFRAAPFSN